jgi:hypothetical protein
VLSRSFPSKFRAFQRLTPSGSRPEQWNGRLHGLMQSWFCFGHVGCSPSTHGAAIKNMVMLFFYMIVGEIIIAWYFMFIFFLSGLLPSIIV